MRNAQIVVDTTRSYTTGGGRIGEVSLGVSMDEVAFVVSAHQFRFVDGPFEGADG